MTTLIINDNSPQAKHFLNYAKTLPFAKVVEESDTKKDFQKGITESKGVSVDAFFDELDNRLKEHYRNA
jgi:hypothetical protein